MITLVIALHSDRGDVLCRTSYEFKHEDEARHVFGIIADSDFVRDEVVFFRDDTLGEAEADARDKAEAE